MGSGFSTDATLPVRGESLPREFDGIVTLNPIAGREEVKYRCWSRIAGALCMRTAHPTNLPTQRFSTRIALYRARSSGHLNLRCCMPITRLSSPAPKVPGDPKKPLVLCVDDDGAVLASLRRLFRGEPYDVITTASAAQALACLRRHPVSVIISDERMPGTSGSELLAEVRERWPWIGRIILTSFPGHEVMIRGLQAGV